MRPWIWWLVWAGCRCQEPTTPNVLIVLFDDLGVDQVGAYGLNADTHTPRLDALATNGLVFERAFAEPSCSPARASLLTGLHPRHHGIGRVVTPASPGLSPDLRSIADVLPPTWTSAFVGKWHLAPDREQVRGPAEFGFDHYAVTAGNLTSYTLWERHDASGMTLVRDYATTRVVDDALALARQMPEPWLLIVSLHAPHAPLHTPPSALLDADVGAGTPPARQFDAMVQAADREMGRLLDGLGARGDRTLKLVLADNGTPSKNVDVFDQARSKSSVHEGGVRIPWVLSGPGVDTGRTRAMVHITDVLPTVAELAGVEVDVDGRSFLANLGDPSLPGHDSVLAEQFGPNGGGPYKRHSVSVRLPGYRYVRDVIRGTEELQALDEDGRELGDRLPATSPADQAALAAARARLGDL